MAARFVSITEGELFVLATSTVAFVMCLEARSIASAALGWESFRVGAGSSGLSFKGSLRALNGLGDVTAPGEGVEGDWLLLLLLLLLRLLLLLKISSRREIAPELGPLLERAPSLLLCALPEVAGADGGWDD